MMKVLAALSGRGGFPAFCSMAGSDMPARLLQKVPPPSQEIGGAARAGKSGGWTFASAAKPQRRSSASGQPEIRVRTEVAPRLRGGQISVWFGDVVDAGTSFLDRQQGGGAGGVDVQRWSLWNRGS